MRGWLRESPASDPFRRAFLSVAPWRIEIDRGGIAVWVVRVIRRIERNGESEANERPESMWKAVETMKWKWMEHRAAESGWWSEPRHCAHAPMRTEGAAMRGKHRARRRLSARRPEQRQHDSKRQDGGSSADHDLSSRFLPRARSSEGEGSRPTTARSAPHEPVEQRARLHRGMASGCNTVKRAARPAAPGLSCAS